MTAKDSFEVTAFLQPADQHWLQRFKETTEDGQDYDVPKEAMKRLAELGVVQSKGFGRYSLTAFGRHVTTADCQFSKLPLMTAADHEAAYTARRETPCMLTKWN